MRRALCVGIDDYSSGPLQGCVSDATRVAGVLSRHQDEAPNFDCRTLVAPIGGPGDVVTRSILRENLQKLFRDPAEVALLFFAGHGTVNDLDGYLVSRS